MKLEILNYGGLGLGDPVGEADIYANARIRGQSYTSTIINDADRSPSRRPGVPPLRRGHLRRLPRLHLDPLGPDGERAEHAGHHDDRPHRDRRPALRGHRRRRVPADQRPARFRLEKAAYDDFERGDDDTYSVPIGDAARAGLTIGDIDRVAIEKSRDGAAGGWFLKGVTLVVNGRTLVRDRAIDRWLEDDHRTWTAPGLARDQRTADVVPVWLQLREDDFGPQDDGDINRYDRVGTQAIAYRPGPTVEGRLRGDSLLRGRLPTGQRRPGPPDLPAEHADGEGRRPRRCRPRPPVTTPPPLPPDPTPPPPGPQPNLVITALDTRTVTVTNQGTAAAGAFNVTVVDWGVVRVARPRRRRVAGGELLRGHQLRRRLPRLRRLAERGGRAERAGQRPRDPRGDLLAAGRASAPGRGRQSRRPSRRAARRRCRRITPSPNQTNAPNRAITRAKSHRGQVKLQNRKSRVTSSVFWSMKMRSSPTPSQRGDRAPAESSGPAVSRAIAALLSHDQPPE